MTAIYNSSLNCELFQVEGMISLAGKGANRQPCTNAQTMQVVVFR